MQPVWLFVLFQMSVRPLAGVWPLTLTLTLRCMTRCYIQSSGTLSIWLIVNIKYRYSRTLGFIFDLDDYMSQWLVCPTCTEVNISTVKSCFCLLMQGTLASLLSTCSAWFKEQNKVKLTPRTLWQIGSLFKLLTVFSKNSG